MMGLNGTIHERRTLRATINKPGALDGRLNQPTCKGVEVSAWANLPLTELVTPPDVTAGCVVALPVLAQSITTPTVTVTAAAELGE